MRHLQTNILESIVCWEDEQVKKTAVVEVYRHVISIYPYTHTQSCVYVGGEEQTSMKGMLTQSTPVALNFKLCGIISFGCLLGGYHGREEDQLASYYQVLVCLVLVRSRPQWPPINNNSGFVRTSLPVGLIFCHERYERLDQVHFSQGSPAYRSPSFTGISWHRG